MSTPLLPPPTARQSITTSVITADLDELVFRHKNRSYGAYPLRKQLPSTLLRAFFGANAVILFLVALSMLRTARRPAGAAAPRVVEVSLHRLAAGQLPSAPRRPRVAPASSGASRRVRTRANQPPVLVPDAATPPEHSIHPIDSLRDESVALGPRDQSGPDADGTATPGSGDADGTGTGDDVGTDPYATPLPDDFFEGELPEALNLERIRRDIRYPDMARDIGLEGTVVLRILVSTRGRYERHVVLRQAHPLLLREVERHLSKLEFRPGRQAGRAVQVWVTLPFRFTIGR